MKICLGNLVSMGVAGVVIINVISGFIHKYVSRKSYSFRTYDVKEQGHKLSSKYALMKFSTV